MDISELKRIKSGKSINRHPWEITRARITLFILKKYGRHFDHIIDIGSGDAFVLQNLAQNEIASAYTAVDNAYAEHIITNIRNQFQATSIIFKAQLHEQPLNIGDCLLLMDVLEHCVNDKEVLQESVFQNHTTNNSFVFITVPAFQCLFSQHDILLSHYRRYSRKKLVALCKSQRLEILHSGYFFFSLLPQRSINLLLEKLKLKKTKKTIDNWKGGSLTTTFISSILWADFRFCYLLSKIGIYLPGLSCYCICRKQP